MIPMKKMMIVDSMDAGELTHLLIIIMYMLVICKMVYLYLILSLLEQDM